MNYRGPFTEAHSDPCANRAFRMLVIGVRLLSVSTKVNPHLAKAAISPDICCLPLSLYCTLSKCPPHPAERYRTLLHLLLIGILC